MAGDARRRPVPRRAATTSRSSGANVPRERAALNIILPGGSWQALFWLEWVVGGLVPFVLLVVPRFRQRFGLLAVASCS